jgi:hypothetical protein
MDQKHCAGCADDFYNGKNHLGIKECWMRRGAKLGNYRLIPIDMRPPYLDVPVQKIPTCYKKPRYAKAPPSALDAKGFWK